MSQRALLQGSTLFPYTTCRRLDCLMVAIALTGSCHRRLERDDQLGVRAMSSGDNVGLQKYIRKCGSLAYVPPPYTSQGEEKSFFPRRSTGIKVLIARQTTQGQT